MTTQPRHIEVSVEELVDLAAGIPLALHNLDDAWSVGVTSATRTEDADHEMFLAAGVGTIQLTDSHLVDLVSGKRVTYAGPANQGYLITLSGVDLFEQANDQD
jgi:hypothetical protein